MATHSLPSDSTARRLRSLEIQNYLIKIAVVVLTLLLLWRTFSGNPSPVPSPVAIAVPEDLPIAAQQPGAPADATSPELKTPGSIPHTPALFGAPLGTSSAAAAKAPLLREDLSKAQIYRITQQLVEATFRDPRYKSRVAEAWSKRAGAVPSGSLVFPEPFVGEIVGPTPQADGYRDYQVWGDGLRDPQAQRPGSVWYMVLWNFDPTTGRAFVESLSIGGKEIVHDWRPYSQDRISVEVE